MAWIESHQSLSRHRKVLRVISLLGVDRHKLIGHLHVLWWWALDNATIDGDMGLVSDEEIATAAEWIGDAHQFAAALRSAGFVELGDDGRQKLHDWGDYAGKLIDQRAAERDRSRRRRAEERKKKGEATGGRPPVDRQTTVGTVPNRTVPNQDIKIVAADKTVYTYQAARATDEPAAASGGNLQSLADQELPTEDPVPPDQSAIVLRKLQAVGILLPSAVEIEKVAWWLGQGMEFDCVSLACDKAALAGKRTVAYIDGILKSWHASGIRTRLQAEAEHARAPTQDQTAAASAKPRWDHD